MDYFDLTPDGTRRCARCGDHDGGLITRQFCRECHKVLPYLLITLAMTHDEIVRMGEADSGSVFIRPYIPPRFTEMPDIDRKLRKFARRGPPRKGGTKSERPSKFTVSDSEIVF